MIKINNEELSNYTNEESGFIKIDPENSYQQKKRKIVIRLENKISLELDENISEKNLRKLFKTIGVKNVSRFF